MGAGVGGEENRDFAQPAPSAAEIRWVGAQHLMHGYCGRVPAVTVAEAGVPGVNAAGPTGGARAYAVRPMALLESRRHLVVRIGPRPTGSTAGDVVPAGATGDKTEQTRARAA